MKIVLLGYMGSGKSTIGKLLSKKLDIRFIDLDDYIESKLGCRVSEVFAEKGELFFRKMEHEFVHELMHKKKSFVLSTGGGTPCYSTNLEVIRSETSNLFYLKVSILGLVERLKLEKENRPLIKNIADASLTEFIGKHLFERNNFYLKANYTINCDGKNPEEIVEEINQSLT